MMVLDFFHMFLGVVVKFLLLLQLSDYKWSNYFRKSGGGRKEAFSALLEETIFLLKVSFEHPVNY